MTGSVKRLRMALCCLMLLFCGMAFSIPSQDARRVCAAAHETESMWQGEVHVSETETGHMLTGIDGDNWSAEYRNQFRLDQFQIDLKLKDLEFDRGARRIVLELKSADVGNVLFGIELICAENAFDAVLSAEGLEDLTFASLDYRSDNGIQARIRRENFLNFDTGRNESKWAMRVNKSLNAESVCEPGSAWASFLDRMAERDVRLTLSGLTGEESCLIACVGKHLFYTVTETAGLSVREGTLGYESVTLEWPPQSTFETSELAVRRYIEDRLLTETALPGTVTGFRDAGLEQGITYRYEVVGYDSLDVAATLCPRAVYRFRAIEVTTRQGSSGWFVGTVAGILSGVTALILLYAFFPRMREKCKKGKRNDG